MPHSCSAGEAGGIASLSAGLFAGVHQERLGELKPEYPPRKLGMAEETELAFVIARITAFEAAFNRTPEGQIRRRMADLKSRRHRANREKELSGGANPG